MNKSYSNKYSVPVKLYCGIHRPLFPPKCGFMFQVSCSEDLLCVISGQDPCKVSHTLSHYFGLCVPVSCSGWCLKPYFFFCLFFFFFYKDQVVDSNPKDSKVKHTQLSSNSSQE